MTGPNYERARQYALLRLETELAANLIYHNPGHTRDDVLPAAERLAELEGIQGEQLLLLRTAVLFHDIGFVSRYFDHETVSLQIAAEVLPDCSYTPEQVSKVCNIIRATRLPQSPHTILDKIMADADLDVIGRDDFLTRNQALRIEMATYGRPYSDMEWFSSQLRFLNDHQYFTNAARKLRDEKKSANIQAFAGLFKQYCLEHGISPESQQTEQEAFSLADRVIILRAVSLFAETPDDILLEIAKLLTPIGYDENETIFNKGDTGDCMYIIVRGRVQAHDGEMVLNTLGPADFFGEMALLDAQPRVASATTTEKAQLLRLGQEQFYELMAHRSEFARGVIRVLNRRLRGRVRDMAEDFLYIQQVGRITAAAAALEAGMYDPEVLDEVCQRSDELGQLARVFQRMANEVQAREQRLKQELQQLRIQIDEVKKAQQVSEITESEYFQQLQSKVQRLKKRQPRS